MKWIISFIIISLLISCGQSELRKHPKQETTETIGQSDSAKLVASLKDFDAKYIELEKSLSDSVFKFKPEDNDFSDLTGGIERSYMRCNNELEKILLGYKLAANYMIHYDSSKEVKYKQKAEPLFYSFICYTDGELASQYMKLDLKKVQFVQKEWGNFSEQDKEAMMFYGLLRGFDDGLPEVLKNVNLILNEKPTYQKLYTESERRFGKIGKLKFNPSTKKKIYNYVLKNDSIKITLYHINDRIATIESRRFDQQNNELSFFMFDFEENNDCFSTTERDKTEKMSYTNAMYWGQFIRFDVNCKIIDINPSEKQRIIQSTKASLDSIMQHFPEFKYSFNWD